MHLNKQYQILSHLSVFFDFDGVFSSQMAYDNSDKVTKTAQYGARHAIEILKQLGAKVYIITGDGSENGIDITNQILSRIPHDKFIKCSNIDKLSAIIDFVGSDDLSKVYYIADDIFDITTSIYIRTIIPKNALNTFDLNAHYRSRQQADGYFVADSVFAIMSDAVEYYLDKEKPYSVRHDVNHEVITRLISTLTLSRMKKLRTKQFQDLLSISDYTKEVNSCTKEQFMNMLGRTNDLTIETTQLGKYDQLIINDLFEE